MLLCWPGFYELSLREENLFFVIERNVVGFHSGQAAQLKIDIAR